MSMSESSLSQASTKVSDDTKDEETGTSRTLKAVKDAVHSATAQDILLFLVAFRILNALTIRTFFQPDEFFQSLEPAWQMVFGKNSGAWITWVGAVTNAPASCLLTALQEWRNHLRSAIHPSIFGAVYWVSEVVAQALQFSPAARDELLLAAPKTVQAAFAALNDYYTWKLAERIYGHDSSKAWAALALTVVSPWQWFCSTRTLSNCLETTLTVIALYNWPWHWSLSLGDKEGFQVDSEGLRIRDAGSPSQFHVDETTRLRRALLLAAVATIMRPTNVLIWATLALLTFLQHESSGWLVKIPWTDQSAWVNTTSWSFVPTRRERMTFFREILVCGTAILLLSVLVDRFYYQMWSFPPLNFLHFNVVQSLSIFYGNNDWHYYLSQGYPLLLTTTLPFALVGIYQALQNTAALDTASATSRIMLSQLAAICLIVPLAFSLISHKEVRFIYPLLPALHILSASSLATFFEPALTQRLTKPSSLSTTATSMLFAKRMLLFTLIAVNATIAIYTSTVHNSGIIFVTDYLRHQHSTHYPRSSSPPTTASPAPSETNMTVGFLMPCHSTPWRSHLIHPGIHAWALTCEPPLHLNATSRAAYLDEADVFYVDPILWLRLHMSRQPPRSLGIFGTRTRALNRHRATEVSVGGRREWPDYLVFFEQLQSVMHTALQGSGYGECWRGFNSHWHDDWRRKGDVVVWCLDPEKKQQKEQKGRPEENKRAGVQDAMGWVKGLVRQGKATVNDAMQLQQPQHHEGKTLGGGRGPYGIGGDVMHPQHKQQPKTKPAAGESTVEWPFWKTREKVVKQPDGGLWTYLWPFAKQKQKEDSWWQGGKWS
jgi:phosphatidylinositol glycan class B